MGGQNGSAGHLRHHLELIGIHLLAGLVRGRCYKQERTKFSQWRTGGKNFFLCRRGFGGGGAAQKYGGAGGGGYSGGGAQARHAPGGGGGSYVDSSFSNISTRWQL